MRKCKNILATLIFMVMLATPFLVTGELTVPGVSISNSRQAITLDILDDLIHGIARFLIIVSVIIAAIFIVYGGIRWVSSPGDPTAAKKIITNGIIRALIILGVGAILQTLAGVISRSFFGTYNFLETNLD